MMKKIIAIILFTTSFCSCATWKASLISQGDSDIAIKNAILDLINTKDKILKEDSVFTVNVSNITEDILGINFYGSDNKFLVIEGKETDMSIFPTNYYESHDKLFIWKDPKVEFNDDILQKLNEYNMIDSLISIAFAEFTIDDAKEGVDFYFCKNNLLNYKKVRTNKIMGRYELPDLKCHK